MVLTVSCKTDNPEYGRGIATSAGDQIAVGLMKYSIWMPKVIGNYVADKRLTKSFTLLGCCKYQSQMRTQTMVSHP